MTFEVDIIKTQTVHGPKLTRNRALLNRRQQIEIFNLWIYYWTMRMSYWVSKTCGLIITWQQRNDTLYCSNNNDYNYITSQIEFLISQACGGFLKKTEYFYVFVSWRPSWYSYFLLPFIRFSSYFLAQIAARHSRRSLRRDFSPHNTSVNSNLIWDQRATSIHNKIRIQVYMGFSWISERSKLLSRGKCEFLP